MTWTFKNWLTYAVPLVAV